MRITKKSDWILAVLATLCLTGASSFVSSVFAVEQADQESIDLVMDALKSGDPDMMAVGIALVRDIAGQEVTRALATELPNLPPAGQVQLLAALADRGDAAALDAVIGTTRSQDESVRVASYKALGQLGNASTVAFLAQAAASTRGDEQKAARDSLYRLRGEGVDEAVLKAIATAEPDVKVELITAVAQRNIVSGVPVLLSTAAEAESKVQRESYKVLKVVAGYDDLPAIIDLLLKVTSSSVRVEAERTIASIARRNEDQSKQTAPVLAAIDKADTVEAKASLLLILGKIGADDGLNVLEQSLSADDAKIREAAIRALSDWPKAAPATELLKIAVHSDNQLHKILALRGYVRLLGLAEDLAPEWKVALYEFAMVIAPDAEKKRVLSGLGAAGSAEALEAVESYLDDESVRTEAQVAAIKLAEAIMESQPARAKAVLEKIEKEAEIETIRKQASNVLNPPVEEEDPDNQ